MNSKHRYILLIFFLAPFSLKGFSQEAGSDSLSFIPRTLSTEEYQNFQLPSLQQLFESARTNPRLSAIEASIQAAKYDTKLAKRDWWSYFSLHAGYNYGILGTYVDRESEYQPLTTTYSGSSQSSWQIGANFNLPLDRLLNHRLNVKKRQQLAESEEYTQEIVFNEIKQEIVELYSNVQYQLKMLRIVIDAITLYSADYDVARNDFVNNKITTSGLTEIKNSQKNAQTEYELIISRINIYLLKLEIITNMKLISK